MSLLTDYINKPDPSHTRRVGRYYASEIGYLRKGYLTANKFFDKKPIDEQGAMNILSGVFFEDGFEKMLVELDIKHDYNPKKEIKIDDFVLVVKPDFVFPKSLVETKAPMRITREIPEKWMDQLESEARAFGKPVYLGVFGNNPFRRFSLDTYKYKQDDARWEDIKNILRDFHKKLVKKYDKYL